MLYLMDAFHSLGNHGVICGNHNRVINGGILDY